MPTTSIYESVTARILAQLEAGVIPWRKEWKSSSTCGLPCNHTSGKEYRGINILLLLASGFNDARWLTYKQAQAIGAQVRRGEHGTKIVFWSLFNVQDADAPEDDSARRVPFMREYTVFNVEQIEGLTQELPFDAPAFEPIPAAQGIVDAYLRRAGITLQHGGNAAFYHPKLDYIQMPARTDFSGPDAYYSTLFHECTHSTRHTSRLDRDGNVAADFGSERYSKEELTAEFGAAFLCAQAGISNERLEANHAAYIQGWVKALKNDPKMLVSAAQRAQRAADYILDRCFASTESEAA